MAIRLTWQPSLHGLALMAIYISHDFSASFLTWVPPNIFVASSRFTCTYSSDTYHKTTQNKKRVKYTMCMFYKIRKKYVCILMFKLCNRASCMLMSSFKRKTKMSTKTRLAFLFSTVPIVLWAEFTCPLTRP